MGLRFLFCGVALAALGVGCTTVAEGVRNMILEPAQYCTLLDDCIDHQRVPLWAALGEVRRTEQNVLHLLPTPGAFGIVAGLLGITSPPLLDLRQRD